MREAIALSVGMNKGLYLWPCDVEYATGKAKKILQGFFKRCELIKDNLHDGAIRIREEGKDYLDHKIMLKDFAVWVQSEANWEIPAEFPGIQGIPRKTESGSDEDTGKPRAKPSWKEQKRNGHLADRIKPILKQYEKEHNELPSFWQTFWDWIFENEGRLKGTHDIEETIIGLTQNVRASAEPRRFTVSGQAKDMGIDGFLSSSFIYAERRLLFRA